MFSLTTLGKKKKSGIEIIGENGVLEWKSKGKFPEENKIIFYDSHKRKNKILFSTTNYDKNEPYKEMLNDLIKNYDSPNNLATLDDYKFYKTIYDKVL